MTLPTAKPAATINIRRIGRYALRLNDISGTSPCRYKSIRSYQDRSQHVPLKYEIENHCTSPMLVELIKGVKQGPAMTIATKFD